MMIAALVIVVIATTAIAQAPQAPPSARPTTKGVWEPVNYSEDLNLNDVFFVSPDVGWIAGDAGTILHTTDGGATWTAQLGGDPSAQDPPIQWIRFLDARHGWALQHYGILLRTTDGENWERIGSGVVGGLTFISPTTGFRVYAGKVWRSDDAGRSWEEVFTCRAKMDVQGLTRDVNCDLQSVYFASASVGYAVGDDRILAKTTDGGAHWSVQVGPEETGNAQEVFFLNEQVGFKRSWRTLYRTADGGATWVGAVASGGFGPIRFADPEIGWTFCCGSRGVVAYTIDGGRRWTTREASFPAGVNGLSAPRRDRAYVVGEHGMVYRYRVVGAAEPVAAHVLAAPTLPTVDSPLDDVVAAVDTQLGGLEQQVDTATAKSASDQNSTDTANAFVAACCTQSVNKLQTAVDALTPLVPQFLAKYRNVNLVIAGLHLLGVLPDHVARVKAALQQLRTAHGAAAATAALQELNTAVDGLSASTRQAFQQEPMSLDGAAANASDTPAPEASVVAPADSTASDSTALRHRAADEARRRLQQAKRRIRIRNP